MRGLPGEPVVALVMCLDGVMVGGGDVPIRYYWSIPRDAIAYVAEDWVGQKKPAVCAHPCRPPVKMFSGVCPLLKLIFSLLDHHQKLLTSEIYMGVSWELDLKLSFLSNMDI